MADRSVEEAIAYHRTFLRPGAPNPVVAGSHKMPHAWEDRLNRQFQEPVTLRQRQPSNQYFRSVTNAPKQPESYDFYRRAYQMINGNLTPCEVVEKYDQFFIGYATPFERLYCKLCRSRELEAHMPLSGVVDENYMVVAHYGSVSGSDIWMPVRASRLNAVQDLWQEGWPVFVGAPPQGQEKLWAGVDTNLNYSVRVLTQMDGRVLYVFGGRSELGLEPANLKFVELAMDLMLIKDVVVYFGQALGRRVARALIRKGAKTGAADALEGATLKIAREEIAREGAKLAPRSANYVRKSGITPKHFKVFQDAARETKLIAVVRNGNDAAIPLIEKGCPGKPKIFEPFNTSKSTGILTATTEADKELVLKSKYILVNDSGVAVRRLQSGDLEKVELQNPFWHVEPGQVIDPALRKPVVGDYDLMGVFSPTNPGQNITLHSVGGEKLKNMTSPLVEQFSAKANRKFDLPRVLHGAQDQYAGFRKGATAFFPDGTVLYMETEEEVKLLYDTIGRQTIKGSHPRPGPGVVVPPDELAARRGR